MTRGLERWWKPETEPSPAGEILRSPLRILAGAYGALIQTRALAFRQGWLRTRKLPARVAVVGNLTLGGSGKTPLAHWLAQKLSAEGRRVAVLSRGYRARTLEPVTVVSRGQGPLSSPETVGDEPFWLAANLPGVPVLIGPDRFRVGAAALREFQATHLVLDDGFQHLRLFRDADLVVVDGRRPPAGEALFPRGRLREPWSALARASVLVVNKVERPDPAWTEWLQRFNPDAPVFFARYLPAGLFSLSGRPAGETGPALAFAGLAEPDYFFDLLAGLVEVKERVRFADHHRYRAEDLAGLLQRAGAVGAARLITTEKDGGKLLGLPPAALPVQVLKVALDFFGQEAECFAAVAARLQ